MKFPTATGPAFQAEKSGVPPSTPMRGVIRSLTIEVTMPPNAAPMITPTARSTTLPRMMNVLNSLSMGPSCSKVLLEELQVRARASFAHGSRYRPRSSRLKPWPAGCPSACLERDLSPNGAAAAEVLPTVAGECAGGGAEDDLAHRCARP